MEDTKNEKVKLPNEICEALNNYKYLADKEVLIWSSIQSPELKKNHTLQIVREYAVNNNVLKVINAILYGYEPEETEEERKERDIKEKMLDYIKWHEKKYLLNTQYIDELYDIAHGKK